MSISENQTLTSKAEIRALEAQKLSNFSGLNLHYIKSKVSDILKQVGRGGIFDEYTLHDISHINTMLESLEWIIPEETKVEMTPADWLLTVLSIYFHDMGMLVTKNEYDSREKSGFKTYMEQMTSSSEGAEFIEKISNMENEKREKFLYQEFVRENHAERIRFWIEGVESEKLGISEEIQNELDKLLEPLGDVLKEDLAMICESHHLDDLTDLKKYAVSKPYGNSPLETVNLQYIAILLRTADLLHITKDRTPTTAFNIINPSDPISQGEWAKQMAVRSVRPAPAKDKNGNVDNTLPKDTIEVHASFNKKDGFFGLTSYLNYAEIQIEKSYKACKIAKANQGIKHDFPWRKIDQDHIETKGFLKEPFNFILDPKKILDLLTGHTLYNDSSVVIRELIQNSLDAVRLQKVIDQKEIGTVKVKWDSQERILSVTDTGTGMSQEVIENFFLRAGVSRYQDPKFKEKYPSFSPISRFGIGILSTFMIADSVEVLTSHPENEKARHISLRTVHGKYLIELLEKTSGMTKEFENHGTKVKLKVRNSVDMSNVLETVKKWIVFPGVDLMVDIDGEEFKVGFDSPKEALIKMLEENGYSKEESTLGKYKVQVREKEVNEVNVAYAVKWSDYFKEWSFLTLTEGEDYTGDVSIKKESLLGMCIEGIRVEFKTPGFSRNRIIAIGNVKGLNSPKTNVAREGIEHTKEHQEMLKAIYKIYCNHIYQEMSELEKKNYSLTWVVRESSFLLNPILPRGNKSDAVNEELLLEEINKIPTLIAETDGKREAISPIELKDYSEFCTIQSSLYNNLESLVRELPNNVSITEIIKNIKIENYSFPSGTILSEKQNYLFSYVLDSMNVKKVLVNKEFRSVELFWEKPTTSNIWTRYPEKGKDLSYYINVRRFSNSIYNREKKLAIANTDIEIVGLEKEIGVTQGDTIYLFNGTEISEYCKKLLLDRKVNNIYSESQIAILLGLVAAVLSSQLNQENIETLIERILREVAPAVRKELEVEGHIDELSNILYRSTIEVYDPSKWNRYDPAIFF